MMLRHAWPQAMANGETAIASAEIAAAPGEVLAALVTSEVERWWGSADTYRMTAWSADLRAGGSWSVIVETAAGRHLPASGAFLEIDMPRRIAQTRRYDWDHPTLGRRETTVAYLAEPTAGGTRLTVCHGGFGGLADAATEHAEGWARVLGWLQAYFNIGDQRSQMPGANGEESESGRGEMDP